MLINGSAIADIGTVLDIWPLLELGRRGFGVQNIQHSADRRGRYDEILARCGAGQHFEEWDQWSEFVPTCFACRDFLAFVDVLRREVDFGGIWEDREVRDGCGCEVVCNLSIYRMTWCLRTWFRRLWCRLLWFLLRVCLPFCESGILLNCNKNYDVYGW